MVIRLTGSIFFRAFTFLLKSIFSCTFTKPEKVTIDDRVSRNSIIYKVLSLIRIDRHLDGAIALVIEYFRIQRVRDVIRGNVPYFSEF